MIASIAGLPAFLLYFVIGLALTAAFLAVYNLTTAHDEFALIRNNVPAAAVSLGLVFSALPCRSRRRCRKPAAWSIFSSGGS